MKKFDIYLIIIWNLFKYRIFAKLQGVGRKYRETGNSNDYGQMIEIKFDDKRISG